jgi:hypothetical protein
LQRHVYTSTLAHVPYAAIQAIMRDAPERLFRQVASDIDDPPQARKIEVHVGPVAIHDRFTIEFGEFAAHPDGHFSRLRLRCHGDRHHMLLPDVDAALEASDAGDDRTELEIAGHYSPPLGALGALEDALVGHRAVEEAMTQLLAGLRTALEATRHRTDAITTLATPTEPTSSVVVDDQRQRAAS